MNKTYLFLLCCLCCLLSGCWDEVNIEERGFVIGTALDLAEEQQSEGSPLVTMTNQFVVPAGLGTPSEGGSGNEKPYKNLSLSGHSLFQITREMALVQGNSPFYEHLKLIVVSADLASEPYLFANTMDLLIRDPEMRRETKVVISEEDAEDILEIESEMEPLPAMQIELINENMDKSGALIEPIRIGDLNENMLEKNNYLIPRVRSVDGRMMFNGTAIFHGKSNRLIGFISGQDTFSVNLITGDLKGGYAQFEIDNNLMVYEIKRAKSSIKIDTDQANHVTIDVTIDLEGNIGESFGGKSLLNKEYMDDLDKKVSKSLEKRVSDIIKKGQEEIGVDFFGFSEIMQEKHHQEWTKIKDDWDEGEEYFQNATINVTVDATIRGIGVTNQSKD
ncbi:Ger(x)C family spore germination protein [Oceanobacillus timonensis]|uniref:Ger(x)C family spore germination protein n=1 Tax=Oceanobacillus timonensis TaxID=1926285 RepID=UPI0009BC4681|nr:Ger(x)C family spore germination protein [Oceanobacillus timonensis]